METAGKSVLDACCGSRMMWFDKQNPAAIFADKRHETLTVTDRSHREDGTRTLRIEPDHLMDFRDMPFADGSFKLVAFDPPHLERAGPKSWLAMYWSPSVRVPSTFQLGRSRMSVTYTSDQAAIPQTLRHSFHTLIRSKIMAQQNQSHTLFRIP